MTSPRCFPRGPTVDAGGYGLVAYRVTRWLQPAVYYSFFAANRNLGAQAANMTTNDENIQDDVAGTLRFDINNFWIVKLEGHYMHGTAALGSGSDRGRQLGAVPDQDDRLFLRFPVRATRTLVLRRCSWPLSSAGRPPSAPIRARAPATGSS